jgi:hypothetical protein
MQVDTPGKTLGYWHEIKIHPGRPEWILAKVRRNVCEEWDASTNPSCAYDLFLTQVRHLYTAEACGSGKGVARHHSRALAAVLVEASLACQMRPSANV